MEGAPAENTGESTGEELCRVARLGRRVAIL